MAPTFNYRVNGSLKDCETLLSALLRVKRRSVKFRRNALPERQTALANSIRRLEEQLARQPAGDRYEGEKILWIRYSITRLHAEDDVDMIEKLIIAGLEHFELSENYLEQRAAMRLSLLHHNGLI